MKKRNQKYFRYFKKYLPKVMLAFVLTLISKGGDFASTHVFSKIVDVISSFNFNMIWRFLVIMILLEITALAGRFFSEKVLLNAKVDIVSKINWNLAKCFAESSVESAKQNQPVTISECLREGSNFVESVYSIYKECFNLAFGIAAVVYSAIISWQMAILSIIFFILLLLIQYFKIKKMIKSQKILRIASDKNRQFLLEIIQGLADIKAQALIPGLKPHFSTYLDDEIGASKKAQNVMLSNDLLSNSLLLLYKALFVIIGTLLIRSQQLEFSGFIALFMYKNYIYSLVGAILNIARYRSSLKVSVDRMDSITEYKRISKEIFGQTHHPSPSGSITVENLTVKYGKTNVLDGISLEIPSPGFYGIVGDSGSGKSTLLGACAHQITPTSGSLKIDGIPLSELDEQSYRRAVCLAPQTPFLFSLSIRENLLLARPNASEQEIWACLKACSADKFVSEKGGLDVILDQSNLSGGERQRLALSRLHLSGGKIILLDEATSALDGESQARIVETIREAANMGHTMLVVAHRVSTLKSADKIFLLEDGKLSVSGTYEELFETSEKFRRLVSLS